MLRKVLPVLVALSAGAAPALAQSSSPAAHVSTADFSVNLGSRYAVVPNVTYLTATGYESKLDVYRRRDLTTPQPTLIFFHGGGWIAGTKEAAMMSRVGTPMRGVWLARASPLASPKPTRRPV